jgi:tetratricopeptide (TPR) repeat protein
MNGKQTIGETRPLKPFIKVVRKILLIASFGCFANWAGNAFAETTNKIVEAHGTVEILTPGATRWLSVATNQLLAPSDRIRTGPNSSAGILCDKSFIRIDPLSEFRIPPPDTSAGLHLLRGILYFFHRDKEGRFRVTTSGGAFAGIRGTEFVMEVVNTNGTEWTTLSVIDGDVRFGNDAGTLGLTNGDQAVAEPGKVPKRTPGFNVTNLLQWCFYYPAVLDLKDLSLITEEENILTDSLAAYRKGDLRHALDQYPANRKPGSDAERIYYAALLLSVGQVETCEAALAGLRATETSEKNQRLANALRTLIAAVKREPGLSTLNYQLSTEFLAASYYEQSRAIPDVSLQAALKLARQTTTTSPEFGFAWERVAELEFSFGRIERASEALDKALLLSPRNAQALALKGFLLAAQNKTREAIGWFDQALAVDSALGNAWLGHGLCRIRCGDLRGGREDLLIAAAMEPQRAALRSYLAKAWSDSGDDKRARKELELAQKLDPKDPTVWLYSALLNEQDNRINEAIGDLEKSQELNENRSVYRSGLLLDQDRAVRSANLARIYAEAGMDDVALREASRAVASDYGNYSAHLFLANSYEQLRQSSPFDLRFETPAFSEYLIASLLGPADGRILAQPVTQQEYTRLFERDTFGFSSSTEYLSRGAWSEYAAQYGTIRDFSYALEGDHSFDPGNGPRLSLETLQLSAKIKQMLGPRDGLFLQVSGFQYDQGNYTQSANPLQPAASFNSRERQDPSILAGLDHRWNNGQHTLVMASHINDTLRVNDPHGATYLLSTTGGVPDGFGPADLTAHFRNRLTVDSVELQHLARADHFQTIAGLRLQDGTAHPDNLQAILVGNSTGLESYFGNPPAVVINQSFQVHQSRASAYLYEHWQIAEPLWLIGGVSFDYLRLPDNDLFAPINNLQRTERQVSPKAALVWNLAPRTTFRAAYSQSLGGSDLDQSVRLEPTQLAGFVQAYRNLFPDAIVGGVGGAHFTTYDASLEHRLPCDTFLAVDGQILRSTADHTVGAFQSEVLNPTPINVTERLGFEERSVGLSAHQLLGRCWSAGVRYRLSEAELSQDFPKVDHSLFIGPVASDKIGVLQTLSFNALFRHPTGFFAGAEEVWWKQTLRGDLSGMSGEDFWQLNLLAGYRFPKRHAEITIGLLNATDRNYNFHPINLTPDLPQQRTLYARFQLNF